MAPGFKAVLKLRWFGKDTCWLKLSTAFGVLSQEQSLFITSPCCISIQNTNVLAPLLLIDPVMLGLLVFNDLSLLEPQSNLFLGALDGVGAVADITADILRQILVLAGPAVRER